MKLLSDLDVAAKRVFLRADLDVPLGTQNAERLTTNAETATRLTNLRPTVDWLLAHGTSKIIIAGHIDRPQNPDPAFSTKQIKERLEDILQRSVIFIDNFDSQIVENLVLLENLRFWPGETDNNSEFAKKLATLADVYVNEAFGNCHRNHASMVALPGLLPHAAGLHLEQEVKVLSSLLESPKRPFGAVIGGVKIETKVPVVANLVKIADFVLVGGEIAKELIVKSRFLTKSGSQFTDNSKLIVATLTPDGRDIDQTSLDKFKSIIAGAKTVVWNGPMGVFEEGFERGTMAVAQAIVASGAYSVVGGGETTQFLGKAGLLSRFGFVSSGGGAMFEFLAGRELPGLKALE